MTGDRSRTRILLSEGSSLSARQAITALGMAGYRVDLCDPDPFCLGRFSRFVRRYHHCPPMGTDPLGYLEFIIKLVSCEGFAVLLPTHEQAYLFASARDRLPSTVGVALASFESFERVQSKVEFHRLLTELALPQPQTRLVYSAQELVENDVFPAYIKTAISTASRGLRMVTNAAELAQAAQELATEGGFDESVLVQEPVKGAFERAQAVFDHGRLVASHAYRQLVVGPGGGDVMKVSIRRAEVRGHLALLGRHLNWHGALSVDYILSEGSGAPTYIDCNPRLVEPVNATLSGVPLAETLVRLSSGEFVAEIEPGKEGTRTQMGILALMEQAKGGRTKLLRECWRLWRRTEPYAESVEELTPLSLDWRSAIPLFWVAIWMMAIPSASHQAARSYASSHQLNRDAIKTIRQRYKDQQARNAPRGSCSSETP